MSAFFKSSLNPAFLLNKIPVTKKSSLNPACSLNPGSLNPAFAVLTLHYQKMLEKPVKMGVVLPSYHHEM